MTRPTSAAARSHFAVEQEPRPNSRLPRSSAGPGAVQRSPSGGSMASVETERSVGSAWDSPPAAHSSAAGSKARRASKGPAPPPSERVRVVLRVRPTLRGNETPGAVEVLGDGKSVKLHRVGAVVPETTYSFDKVLGPESSQADVYEAAVAPVIADVMNGYNGTIMAYGQTGAGKTHTLSSIEPDNIGMMPRAAAEVFMQANSDPTHDYVVLMSYVQIYMELIQDLLRPESENLVIRENDSGVFIGGVQEVQVKKMEDCLQLLQLGERNRAFAFTQLNAHSSRSHAIVMLTVVKRKKASTSGSPAAKVESKVKVGKLFIVDLAGSERLKKSRSEGQRQREAKSINLSLTTLGMCINARADPNSSHVPFRDSKLTRLMQESLGGNAKTSLVLAAADVLEHSEETQQSFQFGSRAMRVKTHPIVNEQVDYKGMDNELMLQELNRKPDRTNKLQAELQTKDEEVAKLQDHMRLQQEQNQAVVDALEKEKQEIDEIRRREAAELEGRLEQKQQEIEKHQAELQSSVSELEHRDRELHDREERLEELFRTVQNKDTLLREFSDEKERLERELRVAKVESQKKQVQHDQEIELMLRQWHSEKSAWSKQLKGAEGERRELVRQHDAEKAAFVSEMEGLQDAHQAEKEAFVKQWEDEIKSLAVMLTSMTRDQEAYKQRALRADGLADTVRQRCEKASAVASEQLRVMSELLAAVPSSAAAAEAPDNEPMERLVRELQEEATAAARHAEQLVAEREVLRTSLAELQAQLAEAQSEVADLRERLQLSDSEAAGRARELEAEVGALRKRLEAELGSARDEAAALGKRAKDAEAEARGLGLALRAAEAEQDRLVEAARRDHQAMAAGLQDERASLERRLSAAQQRASELPEAREGLAAALRDLEELRVSHGAAVSQLRVRLKAAEEATGRAGAKAEARHAQRQAKLDELAERKHKRELRLAQQAHEAELGELRARHRAEEESLAAQLESGLIEREAAAGGWQRAALAKHARELRELRRGFRAEMEAAHEAWARRHDDALAQLSQRAASDLARAREQASRRELQLGQEYTAELAREREGFAAKLAEQHQRLGEATAAMAGQERRALEVRLAEREAQVDALRAEADAGRGEDRAKLGEMAHKHQQAIQALKRHHKAELTRLHGCLSVRHSQDLDVQKQTFQSELHNVSHSFQAEGTELSTQVSQLRNEMAESQRSASSERERLMASLTQQQDAHSTLRAEKEEAVAKLHAAESQVHSLQMQMEGLKQRMEIETQRLASDAELAAERVRSQTAIEKDSLTHKYNLEVQALKDSLRQSEEALAECRKLAEARQHELLAENHELQQKMDELQASAAAAQTSMENTMEELQGQYDQLEEDHQEAQVERGLLIGANKGLNERIEGLLRKVEEAKAEAEAQIRQAQQECALRLEQRDDQHRSAAHQLERTLADLKHDHQRTAAEKAEHERRCAAAGVIQRRFRRGRWALLVGAKTQTEAELQDARRTAQALAQQGQAMEAQRVAGQALTGRQLLGQTFVVAQKTMDDLLASFLIPSRDLEKFEKFNRTKEKVTNSAGAGGGLSPSPGVLLPPAAAHQQSPLSLTPRDSLAALERRPSLAGSTASSIAPSTAVSVSDYNPCSISPRSSYAR